MIFEDLVQQVDVYNENKKQQREMKEIENEITPQFEGISNKIIEDNKTNKKDNTNKA